MTSSYEDIFSLFYLKQTDPTFFKQDAYTANDQMIAYLHMTSAEPHVRNVFSKLVFDDDMESVEYELKNPIDEQSDEYYVKEIFAQGMIICWMRPQVENIVNLSTVLGGKEQKKLLSNYSTNIQRLNILETKLKKFIRNHGYFTGDYNGV